MSMLEWESNGADSALFLFIGRGTCDDKKSAGHVCYKV